MSKLIFFYIIFLILVTLFSYFFVDQNLIYLKSIYSGFSNSNRFLTISVYSIVVLIFFVFYFIFIKQVKERKINLKFIIIITSVILFFSYPAMLSYDIFNYVTTSKILFGYHENPYLFTPMQFIGEPYLQFTRATNKIALYGPFWILLSGIPYALGFGNFLVTLFGFKLIALVFYLLTSLLIFKITKNTLSTAIFALNPLVIIETLISGHNDIVMMFFALLSFYFISKGGKIKSLILLLLSTLIKYATIFIFPVFIYQLFLTIKNKSIDLGKVYFVASISMFLIFFLSPVREEIYPWYGVWFLTFVSTIPNKKILLYLSLGLSMGLSLSYIPYMFSGTYFGLTPYIKYLLVFVPALVFLTFGLRKRIWLKKYF